MYNNDFYWYWLSNIPGIGNKRIEQLINIFGNPKEIYDASLKNLNKMTFLKSKDVAAIEESRKNGDCYKNFISLKEKNITLITQESDLYPEKLRMIYDRPVCLYLKGKLPEENVPSVAVVGARNCSEYGRKIAFDIARQLSFAGVNVISGMARGIDTAAHNGALDGKGYTLGVLAGGVDVCYPRENIETYAFLEKNGGLISEYAPGIMPLSGHFPLRNRIISGLSDIVVVVEAREKSGSLITVDMALEQNKLVMAVPGRITDNLSSGCNELIKMGASILTSPRDILEILNYEVPELFSSNKKIIKSLAREEEMVYSSLDFTPKNLNIILEETGLDMKVTMESLIGLEFKGYIKEVSRGMYVKSGK